MNIPLREREPCLPQSVGTREAEPQRAPIIPGSLTGVLHGHFLVT